MCLNVMNLEILLTLSVLIRKDIYWQLLEWIEVFHEVWRFFLVLLIFSQKFVNILNAINQFDILSAYPWLMFSIDAGQIEIKFLHTGTFIGQKNGGLPTSFHHQLHSI